mmetsp:Transcript_73378/g.153117  ORF Transcript_73378/g.153117 Transcript_73378/m.153117 type:complete len:255 (+) Transcript_73378:1673-2437(+)
MASNPARWRWTDSTRLWGKECLVHWTLRSTKCYSAMAPSRKPSCRFSGKVSTNATARAYLVRAHTSQRMWARTTTTCQRIPRLTRHRSFTGCCSPTTMLHILARSITSSSAESFWGRLFEPKTDAPTWTILVPVYGAASSANWPASSYHQLRHRRQFTTLCWPSWEAAFINTESSWCITAAKSTPNTSWPSTARDSELCRLRNLQDHRREVAHIFRNLSLVRCLHATIQKRGGVSLLASSRWQCLAPLPTPILP